MLSVLGIAAAVLFVFVIHKIFFAANEDDGSNIKVTAPFWLLPYRHFIQKKSSAEVAKEIFQNYGPICYVWFGGKKRVVVNDLDLARRVYSNVDDFPKRAVFAPETSIGKFFGNHIAAANGAEWKHQRKVINPAFRVQMIKSFTDGFVEKIQVFLDILDKNLAAAEAKNETYVFEPMDLLQKMTLDVLGKSVFNYDFDYMQSGKASEFIDAYNNIIGQIFTPKFVIAPWIFSLGLFKEMEQQMNRFDQLIYAIINERRKQMADNPNEEPKDLLGLMLRSVDDEVLTDKQLRDNVFVFFLAGHETTAGTLGSGLFALARYPEEQKKLLEDVKNLKGAIPTYEETQRFEHIYAFIKEVMRFYSPLPLLPSRETNKDEQLGEYVIKAKTSVIININGIHHSPSLWKEPEQFNSARFQKSAAVESEAEDAVTSWMAFGSGPRACSGNNFSLLEQKLFLSMFVQRFVVEPYPDYELQQPIVGIMRPLNLKVIVKRRAPASD